jgi:Dirigent-like protein
MSSTTPTPDRSPQGRRPGRSTGRRTAVVAVGLLTAGVLAGGLLTGSASGDQPEHRRVLRFGVQFSPQDVIDVPPLQTRDGDYRAGDYTVFGDVLTDHRGRRVGTEAGTGTITLVDDSGAEIFYSMAIRLRGGQIAASGLGSPDPRKHLVVTGGTGAFVGARGSLRLVEHGDGTGSLRVVLR